MVMPSNNTCWVVHFWAGAYPGTIGHLYTPNRAERPKPHIPYAIDPGTYAYRDNPGDWPEDRFWRMLEWATVQVAPPIWVAVPDVVFNAAATLANWLKFAGRVKTYGWKIALVVQDGMTPAHVYALAIQPDVIFLGGSTEWKWDTLPIWAKYCNDSGKGLHVGRVNSKRLLKLCKDAGADSCDGTGWFRGKVAQILELENFIREESGNFAPPIVGPSSRKGSRKAKQGDLFALEDVA